MIKGIHNFCDSTQKAVGIQYLSYAGNNTGLFAFIASPTLQSGPH